MRRRPRDRVTAVAAHNNAHGITPRTVEKELKDITQGFEERGLKVIKAHNAGGPDEYAALNIADPAMLIAEL